jgi:hypothetical protein
MSDFKDDFNPQNGDLLYGKAKIRAKYLDRWNKDWVTLGQYVIVDQLNNALHIDRVTSYADLEQLSVLIAQKCSESTKVEISQYYKDLSTSRFKPERVKDDKPEKIKRGGEVAELWNDTSKQLEPRPPEQELLPNLARQAIRRACKFGIAYVATNESLLLTNAKILYAIDDINFKDIVEKKALTRDTIESKLAPKINQPSSQVLQSVTVKRTTGVPITTSEMRYIYRHWSELRNKVFWYLNYQKLELAPWEISSTSIPDCLGGSVTLGSEMWASYREHHLNKADKRAPSNLRDW